MNSKLSVNNFLILKHIDIEIKGINVIIGPQANGKSVIAKLVYFFQSIPSDFLSGIRSQNSKPELDRNILEEFEKRFPRYSWDGSAFDITYVVGEIEVIIKGKKGARGRTKLSLSYSDNLVKLFASKKRTFKKKLQEYQSQEDVRKKPINIEGRVMRDYVVDPIESDVCAPFFTDATFIPASRSFFANLQKNIFTFLASNLDIDPYLKEFGSLYQTSKRFYKDSILRRRDESGLLDELYKASEAIVVGEYEYHDEQDWILAKGKRTNLVNASSGQQESLPMLIVLCVWPLFMFTRRDGIFFIEEPEAHLFPTSQGYIVSILSLLYKKLNTRFFITSHSPYILSALNNCILADDCVKKGLLTADKFTELNGSGMPISFEEVAAYTIKDGVSASIADEELRMIGGDMLDEISEHFEKVMNQLLSCGE